LSNIYTIHPQFRLYYLFFLNTTNQFMVFLIQLKFLLNGTTMDYSRPQSGFTLIELIVAMAVLLILLSIGIPSFNALIKDSRLTTDTNRLVMDINFARSEAIKRGTQVILCRTDAPLTATACSAGTARTWSSGWLLFVSQDSNTVYDAGGTNPDILLKRTEMTSSGITILSNAEADTVLAFNAVGSKVGTLDAVFVICDDRDSDGTYDPAYGRLLTVVNTGRPSLTKDTTATPITSCAP
jgi:type IV fimbrial biogenesis protein FimT